MNTNEFLNVLEVVKKQIGKENTIKSKMLTILNTVGFEEEDIPQNCNLGFSVKRMMQGSKNVYSAIQKLDLDYEKIDQYICFKVEEELTDTEDIYFISPIEVLYLENGCLSIF